MFDSTKLHVPQPILQCLRIKPVVVREQDRYGVVFSDVNHFVRTMLPTRMYYCTLSRLVYSPSNCLVST